MPKPPTPSPSLLPSAASSDGSLIALVVPSTSATRLLIQIYRVDAATTSCSLQQTLTYHYPATSSSTDLRKLFFAGSKKLIALFGNSQLISWDLDRGVLADTISAPDGQEFLDAVEGGEDLFFILVLRRDSFKLYVHEHKSFGGKLQRKIKSGYWEDGKDEESATSVAVSSAKVFVRSISGGGIRAMDRDSGKKSGKIKFSSNEVARSGLRTAVMLTAGKFLAVLKDTGAVTLYDTETLKSIAEVNQDAASPKTLLQMSLSKTTPALLIDKQLYSVDVGSSSPSFSLISQITLPTVGSAALFLIDSTFMTLIYRSSGGSLSAWYDVTSDDLPKQIVIGEETTLPGTKDTTSKRKAPSILGAGQAGTELNIAGESKNKKKKTDAGDGAATDVDDEGQTEEQDDDPRNKTIAERLKELSKAFDEGDSSSDEEDEGSRINNLRVSAKSSFKPKTATTESLKELLSQALQSDDDSLIELALSVHNTPVVKQTLADMDPSLVSVLFSKLITKLAAQPTRVEFLSLWLSQCLKNGGTQFQDRQLAVLRNLLHERAESFADLLRLEGRLSIMCD